MNCVLTCSAWTRVKAMNNRLAWGCAIVGWLGMAGVIVGIYYIAFIQDKP